MPDPRFNVPGNLSARIADVVRLEVAQAPTGLVNLVKNPSGDQGGFGWVTPVPGSTLRGESSAGYTEDSQGLLYTTAAAAGGNYFQTENMLVSAGQYVAASWRVSYTPHARYRARFDWYDLNGAYLSSSAWTSFTSSYADHSYAAVVAPASTFYARLRFEVGGPGGTYPYTYGASKFSVKRVTVAKAATAGELGTVRRNLVPNPSFETNTTGWQRAQDFGILASEQTLTRSSAQASSGSWSLQAERATAGVIAMGVQTSRGTSGIPVTPGKRYAFSARVRLTSGFTSTNAVSLGWASYNSSGAYKNSGSVDYVENVAADTWVTLGGTVTPSGSYPYLSIEVTAERWSGSMPSGTKMWVDSVILEEVASSTSSSYVPSYFDGSTADAGGWDYSWVGTAHASVSQALYGAAIPYIEPIEWADVSGSMTSAQWNRAALDAGTLTAVIPDASLDPATSDVIQKGRDIRLMAFNAENGQDEPLFTGVVDEVTTEYDLSRVVGGDLDPKHAVVTVMAVDNTAKLAQAKRQWGVAEVDHLPVVLEGVGVPWVVNGSSQQSTAGKISRNENATALDQVALTRDSNLAYAWVDRRGTFQAWDRDRLPATVIGPSNQDFEGGAAGWSAMALCTVSHTTSQSHSGVMSLTMTTTGAGLATARSLTGTSGFPVVPGATYTARAWVRSSVARSCYLSYHGYRANGAANYSASISGASATSSTSGWTELVGTFTPTVFGPDAFGSIQLNVSGAAGAGEVHYWDDVQVEQPFAVSLDESDYSTMDLSFVTSDVINTVTVKRLDMDPKSKDTAEVAYGPYIDVDSYAEYGPQSAEFTVAGIGPLESDAQAYAQAILDANADPAVRATAVYVPIRSAADLVAGKAFAELYSAVRVVDTLKGYDEVLRVTGVSHELTADRWRVKLEFGREGGVASPRVQPEVQVIRNDTGSGAMTVPVGGIIMHGGTTVPFGFLLANGAAVSRTTYAGLFEVYGTTFGPGNGSTTFNLPDMRNRFPFGADWRAVGGHETASGGGGAAPGAGEAGRMNHQHAHTVDAHDHGLGAGTTAAVPSGSGGGQRMTGAGTTGTRSPGTNSRGVGEEANDNKAYHPMLALNFIVKV